MNYATLVTQVKDYLETDETTFNTHIDTFIKLAEEDIYRKVQVPATRKNSTSTLTQSSQYLATPSDFLSAYELMVKDGTDYASLVRKDVSFMREAYPNPLTSGTPKYYSLFDHNTLILAPTPDEAFVVELHYFGKPDSIVSASTTWIGDNAENALLFGTILQAYVFLKGSTEVMTFYKAAYDEAINSLQMLGDGLKKKDEYRHGSRRIPV